jgi:hypothetical protein
LRERPSRRAPRFDWARGRVSVEPRLDKSFAIDWLDHGHARLAVALANQSLNETLRRTRPAMARDPNRARMIIAERLAPIRRLAQARLNEAQQ